MLPLQLAELANIVADPVSIVLVLVGLLVLGAAGGAFGYLSLRAAVAALVPR